MPEFNDTLRSGGNAVTQPTAHVNNRILNAHHALNIVGSDIIPGAAPPEIVNDGQLTAIGEAYADLGGAILNWQTEHAVSHSDSNQKTEAIRSKREIVNEKIEALVQSQQPSGDAPQQSQGLTVTRTASDAAAARAAATEDEAKRLQAQFNEAIHDPSSALHISSKNIIYKQVETRHKSHKKIEPSKYFSDPWFKELNDMLTRKSEDNVPKVREDGSVNMHALRRESDGRLLANTILKQKNHNPNAHYELEVEPFRTDNGISFMPISGAVGFMERIRENGGNMDVHFGKGSPALTLSNWAVDGQYNPIVVHNNSKFFTSPPDTYAVDSSAHLADARKLEVELAINDARKLVLQDLAAGKMEQFDPSNQAMMNAAILSKVDDVINTAKERADQAYEGVEKKHAFSQTMTNKDPVADLKKRVTKKLTSDMSPEEMRQATLITDNQVTTGKSLTGKESKLAFNGRLIQKKSTSQEPTPQESTPEKSTRFQKALKTISDAGTSVSKKASEVMRAVSEAGSDGYQWLINRKTEIAQRTEEITSTTPPSEQAEKIGLDWYNYDPNIDLEGKSVGKLLDQQAQRIYNNIEACKAIATSADPTEDQLKEIYKKYKIKEKDQAQILREAKQQAQRASPSDTGKTQSDTDTDTETEEIQKIRSQIVQHATAAIKENSDIREAKTGAFELFSPQSRNRPENFDSEKNQGLNHTSTPK